MLAGLGSGEPGPGGSPSLTNIYATLSSWSIIFTRDTLIYINFNTSSDNSGKLNHVHMFTVLT